MKTYYDILKEEHNNKIFKLITDHNCFCGYLFLSKLMTKRTYDSLYIKDEQATAEMGYTKDFLKKIKKLSNIYIFIDDLSKEIAQAQSNYKDKVDICLSTIKVIELDEKINQGKNNKKLENKWIVEVSWLAAVFQNGIKDLIDDYPNTIAYIENMAAIKIKETKTSGFKSFLSKVFKTG